MKSLLYEHKDFPLQLSLVVCDVVLIVISFMAAYFLRYRAPDIPGPGFFVYHKAILIVIPLWVGVFAYLGLYRIRHTWRLSEVAFNSALAVTVGMGLYLSVSYMVQEFFYSRLLLIFLWVVNIIAILGGRVIFRSLLLRVRKAGIGIRRVLIVGDTPSTKGLEKIINLHPELGYQIVGYLTPAGTEGFDDVNSLTGKKILANTSEVANNTKVLKPDEAIFTIPLGKREELWNLINSFQKEGVVVRFVPDIYEFFSSRMVMEDFEGIPVLQFRPIALQTWERFFKLGFDYLSSIVLLIFLSPLLLYVYLRLKIFTDACVLTKEIVVGELGHPFEICKFHIPMQEVYNPGEKAVPTPFGKFLYRYSITDLPQIINIFKGEMSLVGPRPESPSRVERYSEWHQRRLLIKPGITGLAQVNGLRGFDSSDEKTHFDVKYIEEQSVILDLKILLQTIWVLLKRHNQSITLPSNA